VVIERCHAVGLAERHLEGTGYKADGIVVKETERDCTVWSVSMSAWRANPFLRMVPFTIFQRLSSLGSGGGVNAGTIPSKNAAETLDRGVRGCLALLYEHRLGKAVTFIT